MFASTKLQEVAFGDERVTVKKLNHVALTAAREEKGRQQIRGLRDLGGDLLKVIREENKNQKAAEESPDEATARKARYDAHDRRTVLLSGVVSWTMGPQVTVEKLDDLEEDVAQKLFEAIVDLSLGPIDVKAREEAAKNA